MSPGDGIIFLENLRPNSMTGAMNTGRNLAIIGLHQATIAAGVPSTAVHYANFWAEEKLMEYTTKWCQTNNVKNPIIGISSLYNHNILSETNQDNPLRLTGFLKKFKVEYPHCKIIMGGPTVPITQDTPVTIDAVFEGRSLHIYQRWIQDIDNAAPWLVEYHPKGFPIYRNTDNTIPEDPVVPDILDDYCLTSQDILSFESRLGCRFNCTFCNFEYRNSKHLEPIAKERIQKMLVDAGKIGLTRFNLCDDTFNEDKQKVYDLAEIVSTLDYQPLFVGYNRMDLMMRFPDTVEVLDQAGFHGHFFGIETFNYEASKVYRKTVKRDQAFAFLESIRDNKPHWYITGSFIIGSHPETFTEARANLIELAEKDLVSAVLMSPLMVYPNSTHMPDHVISDFGKNPEKYGITPRPRKKDFIFSDYMSPAGSFSVVQTKTEKIKNAVRKAGMTGLGPWGAATYQTMGLDLFTPEGRSIFKKASKDNPSEIEMVDNYIRPNWTSKHVAHVNNYIRMKMKLVDA